MNTKKGSDKRFINLFSDKFIRYVIDKIANGTGIGIFLKTKLKEKIKSNNCEKQGHI